MKVLVPVKRVVDFNVKIRVKADGSGVELANVKMSMNPFDEIAVEEAVRLKEKGMVHGDRRRLDRSHQVAGDHPHGAGDGRRPRHPDRNARGQALEPLAVAKMLKAVVDAEKPAFVILGKQAIDDDCNQTGQMLAALLGWPQATFASKLVIEGESALVTREVDGGLETLKSSCRPSSPPTCASTSRATPRCPTS